jgi:hypothetical protein
MFKDEQSTSYGNLRVPNSGDFVAQNCDSLAVVQLENEFTSLYPANAYPDDCRPDYFDGIDAAQQDLTAAYSEYQYCDGFLCWATANRDAARVIYCDAKLRVL